MIGFVTWPSYIAAYSNVGKRWPSDKADHICKKPLNYYKCVLKLYKHFCRCYKRQLLITILS